MADPYYGAAPRQESTVVRTNDEFEAMRRAAAKKISEKARQERDRAREGNPSWELQQQQRQAPSLAELMYYTGADADQARRIGSYGDWENYAPAGGWGQKDIASLQTEMNSGNWQAPEFQWNWSEPATPGQIMPFYRDHNNRDPYAASFAMFSGSGEPGGSALIGRGKQRFYEDAMGHGVGQAGLDSFAQQFGAPDFQSLSWSAVEQNNKAYDDSGKYIGQGNSYRGNPSLWEGPYAITRMNDEGGFLVNPDGTETSLRGMTGAPGMNYHHTRELQAINDQYRKDLAPIRAMTQDFNASMQQREGAQIRNEQGYDALTGYGTGGLLDENYSNPFFGQITGREAQQSPFTTPDQKYPWSLPTQQLDLASLMSPGYGGPTGSGSMGAYGGSGWGNQGQNKFGGMGGLGGFQAGPFGAKNPWSPS